MTMYRGWTDEAAALALPQEAALALPATPLPEIFGGIVDQLGMPGFHATLRTALHAIAPFNSCVMLSFRSDGAPIVLERCSAIDPERFEHSYMKQAYRLDPYYRAALERRPIGVSRCGELSGPGFVNSAYFQSYYKDIPLVDEIGLLCPVEPGHTIHISLGRCVGSAPFGASVLADLHGMEPLIASLVRRHALIEARLEMTQPIAPSCENSADPPIAETTPAELGWLRGFHATRREIEVASHVLKGHTNPSISLRLGISEHTVKVHRKRLYGKLSISSQAELFMLHMRHRHPN
ncbi:helix-turn-helix transcriptional regulator [Ancylobacter sp. 6x-1]|uniref:Helix-turn-helix transcriptional regulator n=1 Tax=Ancylobacter crimeensis TaxID=2579147 RepID=A0ABT0DF90_9HYPH|nr:helix-turn-helix transcriptional regulator [Ancylobacter crimeensis]MCK0198625.1 helix-turn-helix transcriptional regulator [Ancylobacter crimeensis]